jgi:hypothetical protein
VRGWIFLAVLLSTLPTSGSAQGIEVTPVVGVRFGGGDLNTTVQGTPPVGPGFEVDDAASFGVHVGYGAGEGEIELIYARENTRLQSAELFAGVPLFDLALETWQLGGNYLFGEEAARVRPFIGIGLGLTRLLPEPAGLSDETRFSFSLDAGAKLWMGRRLGIRLEARWFVTVLDSESRSVCGGGTCRIVVWNSEVLSQADLRAGLILRF